MEENENEVIIEEKKSVFQRIKGNIPVRVLAIIGGIAVVMICGAMYLIPLFGGENSIDENENDENLDDVPEEDGLGIED